MSGVSMARLFRQGSLKFQNHVKQHGVLHAIRWGFTQVATRLPGGAAARPYVDPNGVAFDAGLSVETEAKVALVGLHIESPNFLHGVEYQASAPAECRAALERLGVDHAKFTFLDLGCGKGRALLIAREFGFARLVGVEFAESLSEVCKRNMQAVQDAHPHMSPWEVLCADAATVALPEGPLVVYLYNPFNAEVMRPVAQRLAKVAQQEKRDIRIVYLNPKVLQCWLDGDSFELVYRDEQSAILRARTEAL